MRQLATIRRIDSVRKHFNADALELVEIDGWQCVVSKGDFNPGDLCYYFEIGAFLPVRPEFEFLRRSCYRKTDSGEGFRIKTIKLRGEVSQGLAIPISKILEAGWIISLRKESVVNDARNQIEETGEPIDVTEILGVKKYETPVRNTGGGLIVGNARGSFPDFIPKTDQERLQNKYKKYSELFKHDSFEVTLKLDGSSMTVYCVVNEDGEVTDRGVCSRNNNLKIDDLEDNKSHFLKVALGQGLLDSLCEYCKENKQSLALQGELMGPGVQGNREEFITHHFFTFDMFDIDTQKYLDPVHRVNVYHELKEKNSEFRHVPIINPSFEIFEEFGNMSDICNFVDVAESINHAVAEGFVFKHLTKPHLTFKVISRKYLLDCDTEE